MEEIISQLIEASPILGAMILLLLLLVFTIINFRILPREVFYDFQKS